MHTLFQAFPWLIWVAIAIIVIIGAFWLLFLPAAAGLMVVSSIRQYLQDRSANLDVFGSARFLRSLNRDSEVHYRRVEKRARLLSSGFSTHHSDSIRRAHRDIASIEAIKELIEFVDDSEVTRVVSKTLRKCEFTVRSDQGFLFSKLLSKVLVADRNQLCLLGEDLNVWKYYLISREVGPRLEKIIVEAVLRLLNERGGILILNVSQKLDVMEMSDEDCDRLERSLRVALKMGIEPDPSISLRMLRIHLIAGNVSALRVRSLSPPSQEYRRKP